MKEYFEIIYLYIIIKKNEQYDLLRLDFIYIFITVIILLLSMFILH